MHFILNYPRRIQVWPGFWSKRIVFWNVSRIKYWQRSKAKQKAIENKVKIKMQIKEESRIRQKSKDSTIYSTAEEAVHKPQSKMYTTFESRKILFQQIIKNYRQIFKEYNTNKIIID
jgi:hypothetical protein